MPLSETINTIAFERKLRNAVLLPLLAMAVLACILCIQIQNLVQAAHLVDQSDQITAQANHILELLVDLETGQRGYLIGGRKLFLQPYQEAEPQILPAFERLFTLLRKFPSESQRKQVDALRKGYLAWADNARYEMRQREEGKNYQQTFNQARGKALMDALRRQTAAFVQAEEERKTVSRKDLQNTTHMVFGSVLGLSLTLGVLLALVTRRQMTTLSQSYRAVLDRVIESEQRYATTLTSIGDAVLATDSAGRVTFLNPVAEQLTGWPSSEAIGTNSTQVFHIINEETRNLTESPVARVLREGITVGLANHTLLVSRNGTEYPIDDSGAPIQNAKGEIVGTVLVFHDITERKQQEAEILQLNARLREAMEETHHRFRNGLQLLTSMVDLQQSEYQDTVPVKEMARLNTHIQTLSTVHSLLMEQALKDGWGQVISIQILLGTLLQKLQTAVPGRRFEAQIDEVLLPIRPATSLGIVFSELVANAIACGKDTVGVVLRREGEKVRLEITDDGPGLPSGFNVAREARVGLSLAEHLCAWDLQGAIQYENRIEGGTRVTLTFPLPPDSNTTSKA